MSMKIFVAVFGGIGVILLAIAGIVYVREQSFLSRAETATGTVVDLDLSSSSDGGSAYCPVIEFKTKAGEPVRYYGNVCSSPPSYNIGDQVEVLYDPQEITHVQMAGFWSQYTGVVVLSCIGVPFLLFTLWGALPSKKKIDS
jgi:hypothetical protein